MLKKELAKLVEALKDEDNIDEVLKGAEPVKALIDSGLTLDAFKAKAESDPDFKSYLDSEKDKHATKYNETWQKNNLSKLLEDEIKKRYPDKDPKDLKLEEMQKQIEQMKKDTERKELTNKALKIATEKNLPAELVDFIVGADEKTTTKNLETLSKVFAARDEALKTELLKGTYKPGGQGGGETTEEAVKTQINQIMGIK